MPEFDFSTLVTDRGEADVLRARSLMEKAVAGTATPQERLELSAAMKGCYGANDLNRVGEAVAALADALGGYGYGVSVSSKTDWTEDDIPTGAQLAAYLAGVKATRDAIGSQKPLPASMDAFTVEGANQIEDALRSVHELIAGMEDAFPISGVAISGAQ